MNEALIIVDYQNDFAHPKGALAVKDGWSLQSYLKQQIKKFKQAKKLTIALKDWHPSNHCSFTKYPPHAIMNNWGAQLVISEKLFDKIITKGSNVNIDSYSGFFDLQNNDNGLHYYLQAHKITKLVIMGLATDICVSATIQHAFKLGYQIEIDLNGCKGFENKLYLNNLWK